MGNRAKLTAELRAAQQRIRDLEEAVEDLQDSQNIPVYAAERELSETIALYNRKIAGHGRELESTVRIRTISLRDKLAKAEAGKAALHAALYKAQRRVDELEAAMATPAATPISQARRRSFWHWFKAG